MFRRNKPSKTPTRWDLADLMPEVESQLIELRHAVEGYNASSKRRSARFENAVESLQNAYDARIEDFLYVAQEQGKALAGLHDAPDFQSIHKVFDEYCTLTHEFSRVSVFNKLISDEYYKNPAMRDFADHAQERSSQVYYAFNQIWQNITLDDHEIIKLTGLPSEQTALGRLLAPSPPPPPYVPVEELRAQREAQDVRLADYRHIYSELAGRNDIPVEEQADMAEKMLGALVYQQSSKAAETGHTTASRYAANESLPPEFIGDYLATLPAFRKGYMASKEGETPLPPPQYSWKEATDIVVSAFNRFHPELGELARDAIDDGWVHAADDPQKFHNGYAMGTMKSTIHPANHPYILMNFHGTPTSLRTLGHELGHALVQQLEGEEKYQMLDAGALHETFAHFMGALTMEEAATRAKTPDARIGLQQEMRQSLYNTIHAQTRFSDFESRLYETALKQDLAPLTQEQIFTAAVKSGRAKPAPKDATPEAVQAHKRDTVIKVSKSPMHYTHQSPHYCTNYVLAESGAQALLEQYSSLPADGKEAFSEKWVQAMRDAPQYNYGKAMQHMGISTEGAELLQPAARRIEQLGTEIKHAQQEKSAPKASFVNRLRGNKAHGGVTASMAQRAEAASPSGSHTAAIAHQRENDRNSMQR